MAERAGATALPPSQLQSSAPKSPAQPRTLASAPSSTGRREEVLRALRMASEPQTIAALAADLQLHPNTVRFHLDSLVASGRVRLAEHGPRRRGRPALLYEVVKGMDRGGPRDYRMLAEILVDGVADLPSALGPSAQGLAVEAGRRWGRQRASGRTRGSAENRLVGLLQELGFAPERRGGETTRQIGLRHCPFLELAESHAQVVCPIHLGLMRGAMEAWDGVRTVSRLEPFVEPDLCVAHLSAID
jgi:predicted ArsR family transcriptional regulator